MSDDSLKDVLQKAVEKSIAADVIANIDPEEREKILTQAVTRTMNDYQFRQALDSAIREQAIKEAEKWMEDDHFKDLLTDAMGKVFEKLTEALPAAFLATIIQGFGSKERYNNPNFYEILQDLLGIKESK